MVKISIIGITHIDLESHEKVTQFLKKEKPEAVCLELDQTRLEMLQENQQEIFRNFSDKDTNETIEESDREIEFSDNSTKDDLSEPFEYSGLLEDIGLFESKLAGLIQTEQPGQEMLVAYKVAKEIGAEIYLIDKSINDISKIMEEEVSKEEADKFQGMIDELLFDQRIVVKPIDKEKKENNGKSLLEGLDNLDEDEEINLNEVIEIFKDEDSLGEILSIFGQNFPKLFSILLEDRNSYMIKQIKEISLNHKKIAVVVGYGHVKEVVNGLKEINGDFEIKIIE
ncbi:MAG: TraB/GumN family protein [Candidatus Heimdallarchaeota archaeon]